ncbi:Phytochrome-like protein cph2 [Pseudovibrio axinellae]|uniref:Phytochrome-like protein cph2 n=1 Tax=Pseudovibrio axinellae TaxID=989403 RepID=A0A166ASX4_9HYPH|nr:bifunctional diguanylate cyclase/phosphodiesterase [Pseudovibrio axinellae]KZL21510.1 Phytochrome-like protein cph2 [Pseudovibrio axinellae]SER07671.1 diguanylate cyclase (GGDEF) domain-containing protein [Pseudovibrio axinellae]
MDTIPPHRKLFYATIIIAIIGVIATSFYAIDQATLYFLFKDQAESEFETAKSIIAKHYPLEVVTQEDPEAQRIASQLSFGLRGSSSSQRPQTVTSSWKIPALKAQAVKHAFAEQFDEFELVIVNIPGRPLAVHPRDMDRLRVNAILSDPATYQAWHTSIQSQQLEVHSNFDLFQWQIPQFGAVIPYVDEKGNTRGGFIFSTKPTLNTVVFLEVLAFGSAFAFLLVLIVAIASVMFAWKGLHDRWKTSKTIRFLAHNDPLTHLPNRAVFSDELNKALRKASITASNVYVIAIDVDKFKEVNDNYGHAAGDTFLQIISDRLRLVFTDHLVSRLSGDEFAVMIEGEYTGREITTLVQRALATTNSNCVIDGKEIQISLSMGIAQATDAAWRSSRLLHCADLALYRSKNGGRSIYTWYASSMDEELQLRRELEAEMVRALKLDGFSVVYQAQVGLGDNKLKAFEALLRWVHPEKGRISPEIFIPIAEDTGLIEALGEYVLNKACNDAALWSDTSLKVAVNFSPAQFKTGEIEQKISEALEESGLAPERLEIEITESLLIADTTSVVKSLKKISKMGVSIAMDDFGTGYSSLSYLSRFPFNKIKIDRSFIMNIGKDAHTDAIVAAIIGLGRSLDVLITAEGVEEEIQAKILRAGGCDIVQGYYFGRPANVDPANPHANIRCSSGIEETIQIETASTA